MSWWKKLKTQCSLPNSMGTLSVSLALHLKTVVGNGSIEASLQNLEQSTGYVRREWDEKSWQKAWFSPHWQIRALAYGSEHHCISQAMFEAALARKSENDFARGVFLSREDVWLKEHQKQKVLAKQHGPLTATVSKTLVERVIQQRQHGWSAKEEAERLRAYVKSKGHDEFVEKTGSMRPAL